MAELRLIPLTEIDDHPANPRVVFRRDVIDAIVNNLGDEWPQQHALHVRPVGGRYQIVSGHTRRRAADEKGLSAVWCWVEDMDDDEALMRLVTENNQGELSPLERGRHCFKATQKDSKTGLSRAEWARRNGVTPRHANRLAAAGEVSFYAEQSDVDVSLLNELTEHLSAVHRLPQATWGEAARHVVDAGLSAKETSELVDAALEYLDNPQVTEHATNYLDPQWVATRIFCQQTTAAKVQRLAVLVDRVATTLASVSYDIAVEWCGWLESERPLDIDALQRRRVELEEKADELNAMPAVDRERPQVIVADPPWRYDFSETDSRQIENQYPTATPEEIGGHLDKFGVRPADDCVLFMWATAPKLREAMQVMGDWGFEYKTHAVWDKEKIGMGYWFRGQHELLLVGTRGNPSPPSPENRGSSVFREPRERHSQKPESVFRHIEAAFPTAVKAEIYQREPRSGWHGYGNESAGSRE